MPKRIKRKKVKKVGGSSPDVSGAFEKGRTLKKEKIKKEKKKKAEKIRKKIGSAPIRGKYKR
jgi:hypothetical protein